MINRKSASNRHMSGSSGSGDVRASRLRASRGPVRQTSRLGFSIALAPRFRSTQGNKGVSSLEAKKKAGFRRYRVGEPVLICSKSQWSTLVNRYGFPPGEGQTIEEQSGPYVFVYATVQTVHFDEFAEYYTVIRADTGASQRADLVEMEPFKSTRGEAAALRAANQMSGMPHEEVDVVSYANAHIMPKNKYLAGLHRCCFFLFAPFILCFDWLSFALGDLLEMCFFSTKRQATALLNGRAPWVLSWRVTAVNFLVLCSTWYMFSDQIRLAFLPPSADHLMAVVNLVVWTILVCELAFEVFIRPDGYKELIISDKAYSPTTVRYMSAFHLVVESLSLLSFIPEFACLFMDGSTCDDRLRFSFLSAALMGVVGPTRLNHFFGRAYFALIRFRVFGLVRHWKKMWINNTFVSRRWKAATGMFPGSSFSSIVPLKESQSAQARYQQLTPAEEEAKKRETILTNATNIGTALMVTNSYRALIIMCVIIGGFPCMDSFYATSTINKVTWGLTEQLQASNLVANDNSAEACIYLAETVRSWLSGLSPGETRKLVSTDDNIFLLSLVLTPKRCEAQFDGRVGGNESVPVLIQLCGLPSEDLRGVQFVEQDVTCEVWNKTGKLTTAEEIANVTDYREGALEVIEYATVANYTHYSEGNATNIAKQKYSVTAIFNQTYAIENAALSCFLLQFCVLIAVLGGLSVLRRDAEVLVLGPLRRMLKIVAGYAKNPLIQPKLRQKSKKRSPHARNPDDHDDSSDDDASDDHDAFETDLGSYETEQLINAVSKITDLLRKCWGVAGADIISTNLATREGALTEVFNPTVPGKSVYALFGFAAINRFDHALKNLSGDIMVLINDVAKVLHDEVFRWGFGDSGQCNKNLGAAFLMVFRIGLVNEVIEKLEQATDVMFSTQSTKSRQAQKNQKRLKSGTAAPDQSDRGYARTRTKEKAAAEAVPAIQPMSVSLKSLPGIATFTDRAVVGMLKSYASMHRDKKLLTWNGDFRLGAGVGAFTVSLIYGMDAGWAVEGAVGSEYKIDATYLSPHVNMASRMMSACKQYGVSILLSQAVQELMSDVACSKLRHLDTVTVKGSSVKQRIYTYDARSRGVDFFLFSRTDDQADLEADRYSPNIWNIDQDLKAMRQHLTDDFLEEFKMGRKYYLSGDWATAIQRLHNANDIMLEMAVEEGYLVDSSVDEAPHQEELAENGDGPTLFLLNFMKSKGGVAPAGWEGWHPLLSK